MSKERDSSSKDGGSIKETETKVTVNSKEGRILFDSERIAAERRLVRKLDSRLLPMIFFIYVSHLSKLLRS